MRLVNLHESGPRPRVFYRGTNPGDSRRISTGNAYWDSLLFVSSEHHLATDYGTDIETITARPDANIVYQGTREFQKLAKGLNKSSSLLDWCSTIAKRAQKAGYDAVWFQLQGTIGTAIINRDKFERQQRTVGEALRHFTLGPRTWWRGPVPPGVKKGADDREGILQRLASGVGHAARTVGKLFEPYAPPVHDLPDIKQVLESGTSDVRSWINSWLSKFGFDINKLGQRGLRPVYKTGTVSKVLLLGPIAIKMTRDVDEARSAWASIHHASGEFPILDVRYFKNLRVFLIISKRLDTDTTKTQDKAAVICNMYMFRVIRRQPQAIDQGTIDDHVDRAVDTYRRLAGPKRSKMLLPAESLDDVRSIVGKILQKARRFYHATGRLPFDLHAGNLAKDAQIIDFGYSAGKHRQDVPEIEQV